MGLRAVSETFQSSFRGISEQFQCSFRAVLSAGCIGDGERGRNGGRKRAKRRQREDRKDRKDRFRFQVETPPSACPFPAPERRPLRHCFVSFFPKKHRKYDIQFYC